MGAAHTRIHISFTLSRSLILLLPLHMFSALVKAPSATSPTKAAHSRRFFCPCREKEKLELGKKELDQQNELKTVQGQQQLTVQGIKGISGEGVRM